MIETLRPYDAFRPTGLPWLERIPAHWSLFPNRALVRRRRQLVGHSHSRYALLSLTKHGIILRDISSNKGKFSSDMGTSQEVRVGDLVFCFFDVPETPRTVGLSSHHGMITGAYTVFEAVQPTTAPYFELFYRAMDDSKLLRPLYSGLRNTIPVHRFLGTKTPFPPPEEQAGIVRFLDHANRRIDQFVRAKRKLIQAASEARASVTDDVIRNHATRLVRLTLVTTLVSRPVMRERGVAYVRLGLRNRGRGIFHKAPRLGEHLGDSDFFWVAPGDLVISGQFAWEGAVAIASEGDQGTVVSHRYPVLRANPKAALTPYLWAFLRSGYGELLLGVNSRGAAGRNRPLNERALRKEKIPVPPLALQQRVAELVAAEADIRRAVDREIATVEEYRARLVADIVTGQLDVRQAAAALIPTTRIETGEPLGDDSDDRELDEDDDEAT